MLLIVILSPSGKRSSTRCEASVTCAAVKVPEIGRFPIVHTVPSSANELRMASMSPRLMASMKRRASSLFSAMPMGSPSARHATTGRRPCGYRLFDVAETAQLILQLVRDLARSGSRHDAATGERQRGEVGPID